MKKHFGVYGVILREDKLLLVKKTRGPYSDLLDLPGGKPEPGESFEEALIREVKEETGILVEKWEFLEEVFHTIPGFEHTGRLYRVTQYNESHLDMSIHQEDVGGAVWKDQMELDMNMLTPFVRSAVSI